MQMGVRRFTRLTNAFSKKVDNHKAALALYFMHYNVVSDITLGLHFPAVILAVVTGRVPAPREDNT